MAIFGRAFGNHTEFTARPNTADSTKANLDISANFTVAGFGYVDANHTAAMTAILSGSESGVLHPAIAVYQLYLT